MTILNQAQWSGEWKFEILLLLEKFLSFRVMISLFGYVLKSESGKFGSSGKCQMSNVMKCQWNLRFWKSPPK